MGRGGAYIKINESEIADDYPEPAQYEKVGLHHIKTADAMQNVSPPCKACMHACMQEGCLAPLNTMLHANAAVASAACLVEGLFENRGFFLVINVNDVSDSGPLWFCKQEEEETDELLLLEEEMLDADPEDLPRRLLTNFAIYNSEVSASERACLHACSCLSTNKP